MKLSSNCNEVKTIISVLQHGTHYSENSIAYFMRYHKFNFVNTDGTFYGGGLAGIRIGLVK